MAPDGLTICPSIYGPDETLKRLEAAITNRGMTIFSRIDHAAAAAEVGLELRATVVLIFGSARAGTPLMQAKQTLGIDLPLKMLTWQDAEGKTWLAYNDPAWLAKRHGIERGAGVDAMSRGLAAIAKEATAAVG
jgi:uncharacterized protein (DUF302 family)